LNLFIDEKQDLTEYFRTLHSKTALKILKSFPKTGKKTEETESSKRYSLLKKKLKPVNIKYILFYWQKYIQFWFIFFKIQLFEPNWPIEIGLFLVTFTLFVTGSLTDKWYFSIPILALIQTVSGWIAHSMNHNRNPILKQLSRIYAPLTAGMTNKWWGRKHNQVK